jgi:hypothetical protein
MQKRLFLYNNSAFRGMKWERGDFIIGVLNKTAFSFFFSRNNRIRKIVSALGGKVEVNTNSKLRKCV